MNNYFLNDPDLDKLFYAALEVKKAGKVDEIMMKKIVDPNKTKLLCAIEGIDNLDGAIDIIFEYQQKE